MDSQLSRVEADLQVMRSAMEGRIGPPDVAMPHVLLAGAGVVTIGVAWVLQITGSDSFPLLAALGLGVPPLAAMGWWGQIKKKDSRFEQGAMQRERLWREFWWQMVGSFVLMGVLMLCGLSAVSAPVILAMMAVLMAGLLQRPMIERRHFSGIGWCVALGLLGVVMVLKWNVPGPRGSVVGYVLMLGGGLAAVIATWTNKPSANGSAA
jgi:hypothetical protein